MPAGIKNGAETDRQEDVGRHQAHGHDAGRRAAVQFQMVHHLQQRRHQHRNKRNMHRNQVLRANRSDQQNAQQQILHLGGAGLSHFSAEHADQLVRQQIRQAGFRQRQGKCAQNRIGQRHFGAVA